MDDEKQSKDIKKSDTKDDSQPQVRYSYPPQQPTNYPPPQPPYVPPPYVPPPYYAPPPPPPRPPMYTWEIFPHLARNLIRSKEDRGPALTLISVFLIVSAALVYPMAGMFIYYGISENVDFEGNSDLEGRIVNKTGDGISGVLVEIMGTRFSTYSDSEGNYEIPNAPNGIKKIRLTVSGYKMETNTLLLHPDFGSQVDFQMEEGSGNLEFNNLWFFFTISILMVLFSIFTIYGSYFASKKKRFAVVLVGSVLGMLTMAPSLLFTFLPSIFIMGILGFILSCSATIMTITNRKFFTKTQHDFDSDESTEPKSPSESDPAVSEPKL
jgi:hypothetical protein